MENTNDKIELIKKHVCCPDCKTSISYEGSHFRCDNCQRQFPFYDNAILEILPKTPSKYAFDVRSGYHEKVYNQLFSSKRQEVDPETSWANPDKVPVKWLKKKNEHVGFIKNIIEKNIPGREVLCDFTGSSGYYTFELRKLFKWVFHCDLSIESLLFAKKRAEAQHIDNLIFIRADYTKPPFNSTLDLIICGDTLIYSPYHEGLLLNGMQQSLKEDGQAIFDFHNWWHNPLKQIGIMKTEFGFCYSYSKKETDGFVNRYFSSFKYWPYYQEFSTGRPGPLVPGFFPSTRHCYIAKK